MKKNSKNFSNVAGYTLVEVLVSGILLVFSVTAAVAVVGTGSQLTASDNDRRQARAVIRSVFEQSYDYRDFNSITLGSSVEEIAIDERMGTPLLGQLTHTVSAETFTAGSGTSLSVKRIVLSLHWTSTDGMADSLSFTKIVARAR
jgi:type II secretory pathway pseudopilin PulG